MLTILTEASPKHSIRSGDSSPQYTSKGESYTICATNGYSTVKLLEVPVIVNSLSVFCNFFLSRTTSFTELRDKIPYMKILLSYPHSKGRRKSSVYKLKLSLSYFSNLSVSKFSSKFVHGLPGVLLVTSIIYRF